MFKQDGSFEQQKPTELQTGRSVHSVVVKPLAAG